MNSSITDHGACEIDNRRRYRELLAASQQHYCRCGHYHAYRECFACDCPVYLEHKAAYHYDFHDAGASLWECLGWSVFALLMLGGLADALMWGLR